MKYPSHPNIGIEEPDWVSKPEGMRYERHLAFDFETFLSRDGLQIPRFVVCGFFETADDRAHERSWITKDGDEIRDTLLDALLDPHCHLINHNIVYDLAVACEHWPELIEPTFHAFNEGRIHCTMIRQMMIYLAEGRFKYDYKYGNRRPTFGLWEPALEYLGLDLKDEKDNPDAWRMRYHQLIDIPIEEWDEDAVSYAKSDPVIAYDIFWAQCQDNTFASFWEGSQISSDNGWVVDAVPRTRKHFALQLTSARGIRTEKESVDSLREYLEGVMKDHSLFLQSEGIIRENKRNKTGWSKTMIEIKKRVYHALDGQVDLTGKGKELLDEGLTLPENPDAPKEGDLDVYKYTSTASDVLALAPCRKDPVLNRLVDWQVANDELTKFLPTVELGTKYPVCTNFWPLVITGRNSSRNPNMQNMPRRPGVRECFVPRDGFMFVAIDYDSLEVRTWAQACLDIVGYSTAAENYQEDPNWDPHSYFGAVLAETTYEEFLAIKGDKSHARYKEIKKLRQLTKVPNFGLPGGMGAATLIEYGWSLYRVEISEEMAERLAQMWKELYPEHKPYFDYVTKIISGDKIVRQLGSGRLRGDVGYCDGANTLFQGLAADGSLLSLYRVAEKCYARPNNVLFGSRPVAYIHDEIILEVPEDRLHEAAFEATDTMIESVQRYTPDIPICAEPAAMRRWYKDAEPTYDDNGLLIPWEKDHDEE